uniref:metallophosphoesterase family protein n=2 Tax=Flavobacterium sp. TaxID=239 RepID=UPI0040497BEB
MKKPLKILHTADWHLGKRLNHFSRLEEQREVLEEIIAIAERESVDLVVIAGDLFDAFNPPTEALELFYKTLKRLSNGGKRPVIAIAGNHDSPDRIDAPDPLARECGILLFGNPTTKMPLFSLKNCFEIIASEEGFISLQLPDFEFPVRIIATPFANENRLKTYFDAETSGNPLQEILTEKWHKLANQYCDEKGVNLLVTHLYMMRRNGEILEEPDGEKPLKLGTASVVYSDAIPKQIQYTALGHLHKYQNVGNDENPVVYSSSPLCYSFAEAGQKKQVVLITATPEECTHTPIPLTSGRILHRKKFDTIEKAVTWLQENPNTLVELTLVSDTFLEASALKQIHQAHDGIIHIIPIISSEKKDAENAETVNLDQDLKGLFVDFFKSKNAGVAPDAVLLSLFQEITNEN